MILDRILAFLREQRTASLGEIARAVNSSPDAVRSMLDTLQRRDLVHRFRPESGCGTACRACAQGDIEVYGHGPRPTRPPEVVRCEGFATKR